jgi:hypothetical protein
LAVIFIPAGTPQQLFNAVQNTIFTLLSTLAPLGLAHSKFDVLMKPTGLLPQHPLCCPANIAIHLKTSTNTQSSTLALNITITPVSPHLYNQPHLNQPANLAKAKLHSICTKLKGRTHDTLSN